MRAAWREDGGAAVVEFVMISVLLVFLLFGVLQVAAMFYVRNVVAASAADAARYAAAADVAVDQGGPRADALVQQGLSPAVSSHVRCVSSRATDAPSGLAVVRVHCSGRIASLFLPIGAFVSLSATAEALKESR